jgi:hypothetical protein
MNRLMMGSKGLKKIPDIADSLAFEKGVEWFVEVVFFYGILCVLAVYELNKNENNRLHQEK